MAYIAAFMESILNIMQKCHSRREIAVNTTQKAQVFTFGENALKLIFVYKNSIYLGQKLNFISLLHDCVWNRFVKIKCNVECDIVRSITYQSKAVIYTVLLCSVLCAYLVTLILFPTSSLILAHTISTSPVTVADFYLLIFPYYYYYFSSFFGLVSWFFSSSSSSASLAPPSPPPLVFFCTPSPPSLLQSSLHLAWVSSWLS